MCRDFAYRGEKALLEKMIKVLKELASSSVQNSKKGGLIGLSAMAVGLGKDSKEYTNDLFKPVLASLYDHDPRVRHYACEAVFNVVKILREDFLECFCELFDALSELCADSDPAVRRATEALDKLVKDVVNESSSFELSSFIPLLRERMYPNNPYARQFIVSWIQFLQNVPHFNMIRYLPELLEGLFKVLEDPNKEIRTMCANVLQDFLNDICDTNQADFSSLVNILLVHSQAEEKAVQFIALSWLKEFVNLAGRSSLLPHSAGLLSAILPRLAESQSEGRDEFHSDNSGSLAVNIKEVAKALNYSLMQLVTMNEQDIMDMIGIDNQAIISKTGDTGLLFDFSSIVEVLTHELDRTSSTRVKLAILDWFNHLLTKVPNKVMPKVAKDILPSLVHNLKDSCDAVVLKVHQICRLIFVTAYNQDPSSVQQASSTSSLIILGENGIAERLFRQFMDLLLQLFAQDLAFLENRGSFIITNLCIKMHPEDIFRSMSEILKNHEDMFFAYKMVQTLNLILLTSSELHDLRSQLREMKTDESCSLFCCLYRTWCHNPVATVALCLLTKNYKHASRLVIYLGDLEVTVSLLTEIDQLVQLVESPIFACKSIY